MCILISNIKYEITIATHNTYIFSNMIGEIYNEYNEENAL